MLIRKKVYGDISREAKRVSPRIVVVSVMVWCWLFCIGLFGVFAELVVGSFGLFVPIFAFCAFYCCVVTGWRTVLILFVLLGSILDLSFGRCIPFQCLFLPFPLLCAQFWRRHGDCVHAPVQLLPGGVVGGAAGMLALILSRPSGALFSLGGILRDTSLLVSAVLGGIIAVPVMCRVLDGLAMRLDLPQFRDAYREETGMLRF